MSAIKSIGMKFKITKTINRVRKVPFQFEIALKTWDNFDIKLYEKIVKIKSQNV